MHEATGQGTRPIVYAANPHEAVAVSEIDPLAEPGDPGAGLRQG